MDTLHHSNTQLQEEKTVHIQDMEVEGEEEKDEAEEVTLNTETIQKAQQHWKPKKTLLSPTQKNLRIGKSK